MVPAPVPVLPGPCVPPAPAPRPLVLPVPARSSCRHLSLSMSRFSHLLRPPMVCVCEGVTLGVCDGVALGVCDGLTLGVCDGVPLGVVEPVYWAKDTPPIANNAAAVAMLRSFIRASFMQLLQL